MAQLVHGVDLVEVSRIEDMLERHGASFVNRVFTVDEQHYAEASPPGRAERYAARFAAKEAVLKALGTGWAGGMAWTDVGVKHGPNGQPLVHLSGMAAEEAGAQGVSGWVLTLSHVGGMAMASVIGVCHEKEV